MQHGAFKRDSTKDFALKPPWHRRALMAIVWKMWPSLPNGKGAVDYSLQASLTFRGRRRYIWSSPRCWSCPYPSKLCVSCSFHQIQANEFCLWKLAGAHARLCVKRWQVPVLFVCERSQVLFSASRSSVLDSS